MDILNTSEVPAVSDKRNKIPILYILASLFIILEVALYTQAWSQFDSETGWSLLGIGILQLVLTYPGLILGIILLIRKKIVVGILVLFLSLGQFTILPLIHRLAVGEVRWNNYQHQLDEITIMEKSPHIYDVSPSQDKVTVKAGDTYRFQFKISMQNVDPKLLTVKLKVRGSDENRTARDLIPTDPLSLKKLNDDTYEVTFAPTEKNIGTETYLRITVFKTDDIIYTSDKVAELPRSYTFTTIR